MKLIIDPRGICDVIYNARSKSSHPSNWPHTAPATQNELDEWSGSHMKRHLQWAEQAKSPFKLTTYCACHAKWIAWVIRVTHETSFPMSGASKVTLPTSPSTAPATKFWGQHVNRKSRIAFPPIERRFDDDNPNTSDDKIVISRPPLRRPYPCDLADNFVLWNTTFRTPAISTCHKVLRLPRKVTLQLHQILCLPHKMNVISDLRHIWIVVQCGEQPPTSPNTAPATKFWCQHLNGESWIASANRKTIRTETVTELLLQWTEMLTLLHCDFKLLLYWTVILLNCYFTELLLHWTVTLLNCWLYWTVTWLNRDFKLLLYWTVTVLNCDLTELWLYWTVTLLNCYFTERLLYWTVTVLNCDFTELWLYWAVTLLNCYVTEMLTLLNCDFKLLLYWTVTVLNCDFKLLLYWTVTVRNCDFTELLLYWTVTLLNCYFTELLLYWTVTLLNS